MFRFDFTARSLCFGIVSGFDRLCRNMIDLGQDPVKNGHRIHRRQSRARAIQNTGVSVIPRLDTLLKQCFSPAALSRYAPLRLWN
jgi:hypothetical protein